jgi:hypothetical protein
MRRRSSIQGILLALRLCSQTSLEETVCDYSEENTIQEPFDLDESHPLDINTAPAAEIEKFPLLHHDQVERICRERKSHGFENWLDFQIRSGLDEEMVEWISHYFYLGKPRHFRRPESRLDGRERLSRVFPESAGYQSGLYPGNTWKIDQQIRWSSPGLQWGLRIEKDAGETAWNDHQVAYVSVSGSGFQVIAGHYQIETGLGLSQASSFGAGKSALPETALPQYRHKLKGYLSANESPPHFGLAARVRFNRCQLLAWLSRSARDARSDSLIRGFPATGLHRTESERMSRDRVFETQTGVRMTCSMTHFSIGCTHFRTGYSSPVAEPDAERQRYQFHGRKNSLTGLDLNIPFKPMRLSAEWVRTASGGSGLIAYGLANTSGTRFLLLFRRLTPDFQNPNAKGFASGQSSNETGWYIGCRLRAGATRFNLYYDLSRTFWRTYLIPMPEHQSDLSIEMRHALSSRCRFLIRWRRKTGPETVEVPFSGRMLVCVRNRLTQQLRTELTLTDNRWSVRTRFECIRLLGLPFTGDLRGSPVQETGMLLFQEIGYLWGNRSAFRFRWTTFETGSYATRIYIYENNLPGMSCNVSLYGSGFRWIVRFVWKPGRHFQWSLNYGRTFHDGQTFWGNGPDRILSDTVHELGLQIDWTR